MALILIYYLRVLIVTLIVQSISTQTIYPIFTSDTIDQTTTNQKHNKKESNKLITIKPAFLKASSLTSLLKKPHLNLFNKPSSVAFLKIKNKKYLPQFIFSSNNKNKFLPTYQLATPVTSSILGTSLDSSLNSPLISATTIGTSLNSAPLITSLTAPSIKSIESSNLKSTGTKQVQFITKPVFLPIENNLKKFQKFNTWNKLLAYNNFNNQLPVKTSLPVFVFNDENLNNNNNKFIDNNLSSIKLANNKNNQNDLQNPYNNVNQTNLVKTINYNNNHDSQFSKDFKPIVSNNQNIQNNNFRTGRTVNLIDKGQIRQNFNEVKLSDQLNYLNTNTDKKLLLNNLEVEQNILNTIKQDIESKNIKFIKSIIFPKKEVKLDEKVSSKTLNLNNLNNNLNHNNNNLKQFNNNNNNNHNNNHNNNNNNNIPPQQSSTNQFNQGNNQISRNNQNNYQQKAPIFNQNYQRNQNDHNLNNLNNLNNNPNNNFNNPNQNQPLQQQSVQHVLKLQQNNNNMNKNNLPNAPDKQNSITNHKDKRPEQGNQNQVKMPKFKVIQYSDKNAIEEFTRALEDIDFKSITQNELSGVPEFIFDKLANAKIETIIGHKDTNQQLQNKNDNYSNKEKNDFQSPKMQYFNVNDNCAKNRKNRQMNSNMSNEKSYTQQQNSQQQNYQQSPPQQQSQQQNYQQSPPQQQSQQQNYQQSPPQQQSQQQNYQQSTPQHQSQTNNQQPNQQNYQQPQQMSYSSNNNQIQHVSSSQQKPYFNDQQSNSLNSLVNFDDHINFYSTATKLRQLKVLPSDGFSNQLNNQLNKDSENQMNQLSNLQSAAQSNKIQSNLNNDNNEINDGFRKEINDETDQLSTINNENNDKNKPIELDIESGLDETVDQLDNLSNASNASNNKKSSASTASAETDSFDPTKLDLKIIHLPVSVLKKLVDRQDHQKKKK